MQHAVALVFGALFFVGCSTTLGGAGAHTFHPDRRTLLGVRASSLADLPLFDTEANVALGIDARVLQRLASRGTAWGDLRLQGLLGVSHMPRQHESRFGYEALFAPGVARYYANERPRFGAALGAAVGAPVRLSAAEPPWRADDLVGADLYLVPSLGGNWLGLEELELAADVSLRIHFFSGVTP